MLCFLLVLYVPHKPETPAGGDPGTLQVSEREARQARAASHPSAYKRPRSLLPFLMGQKYLATPEFNRVRCPTFLQGEFPPAKGQV